MTLAASLRDVRRLDLLATGDSPLHRLDPRAKLVAALAVVAVAMSYPRHTVGALLPWFALPLGAAVAAGLPLGFLFRRALVVLPFAAVVAIANPWFDRVPLLHAGPWTISGGWLVHVDPAARSSPRWSHCCWSRRRGSWRWQRRSAAVPRRWSCKLLLTAT
jgi:cobalt/nickel transport system permease protein